MFRKVLLILLLLIGISSCANKQETELFTSIEQLNGQDMGCMSGSIFDELISKQFPDSNIIYFSSRSELLLGLDTGKIKGFISDEPVAMMMVKQNEGVTYLDEAVGEVDYGICVSENAKDKLVQLNQYLAKINTNGHLKQLQEKWINPDGASQKKEELTLSGENGTLHCATTPDAAPFSFLSNNVFQGYEVEILNEFCHEYGYALEINVVSFDALLTSIATNKYDIAFNGIYITPERQKSVNFTTPTYKGKDVVMVSNGNNTNNKTLIESLKDSFYKTFIEEDRYQLLLKGADTTLKISNLSIIFGSIFGLFLYILSTKNKTIRRIINTIQQLLAKLPAVVFLMMLFYVIFKTSSIDATIISIIGFTIIFGNVFYGLLKTGVNSVDKGQNEAALALGYDNKLSFFHIVLPQALKTVYETYLSEVIALIKNTSIIGYVSVTDVTRASDIIRGRTYEALFPLLVVAVIYYLACSIIIAIIRVPIKAIINRKVKYDD